MVYFISLTKKYAIILLSWFTLKTTLLFINYKLDSKD